MGKTKSETSPSSRPPINWDDAARLLAVGLTSVEVAQLVGTRPGTINARLKRVKSFRDLVEQYRHAGESRPKEAYKRFCRLVYAHLERQVRAGNLRVVLWIADRLKLIRPTDAAPDPDLERLLESVVRDGGEGAPG